MLASLVGDGCEGFNTASFERIPLLVPPCPPSGLEGCNIIDIEYYVEVSKIMLCLMERERGGTI